MRTSIKGKPPKEVKAIEIDRHVIDPEVRLPLAALAETTDENLIGNILYGLRCHNVGLYHYVRSLPQEPFHIPSTNPYRDYLLDSGIVGYEEGGLMVRHPVATLLLERETLRPGSLESYKIIDRNCEGISPEETSARKDVLSKKIPYPEARDPSVRKHLLRTDENYAGYFLALFERFGGEDVTSFRRALRGDDITQREKEALMRWGLLDENGNIPLMVVMAPSDFKLPPGTISYLIDSELQAEDALNEIIASQREEEGEIRDDIEDWFELKAQTSKHQDPALSPPVAPLIASISIPTDIPQKPDHNEPRRKTQKGATRTLLSLPEHYTPPVEILIHEKLQETVRLLCDPTKRCNTIAELLGYFDGARTKLTNHLSAICNVLELPVPMRDSVPYLFDIFSGDRSPRVMYYASTSTKRGGLNSEMSTFKENESVQFRYTASDIRPQAIMVRRLRYLSPDERAICEPFVTNPYECLKQIDALLIPKLRAEGYRYPEIIEDYVHVVLAKKRRNILLLPFEDQKKTPALACEVVSAAIERHELKHGELDGFIAYLFEKKLPDIWAEDKELSRAQYKRGQDIIELLKSHSYREGRVSLSELLGGQAWHKHEFARVSRGLAGAFSLLGEMPDDSEIDLASVEMQSVFASSMNHVNDEYRMLFWDLIEALSKEDPESAQIIRLMIEGNNRKDIGYATSTEGHSSKQGAARSRGHRLVTEAQEKLVALARRMYPDLITS